MHQNERNVLTSAMWLSNLHTNAALELLKKQFPKFGGFQSILLQLKEPIKNLHDCIQIIHIDSSHWAVISTVGCDTNQVRYYDSANTILTFDTEKIISKLIPTTKFQIEVDIMKMTKQVGSNDCGLYTIAVATSLAHQVDPTTVIFEENEMRSHLAECFMKQKLTSFPTKKRTRPASSVLRQ